MRNTAIYWNYYNDYKIIEDETLTSLAKKENTSLLRNDALPKGTRDWFNYAHIISKRNNFNVIYESCFIYYVTSYFAGDGVSAGAEEEYFYKKLDKKIYSLFKEAKKVAAHEPEQKKIFFNSLVNLFSGKEIRNYEKKIFQHNIRVNTKIKNWAKSFPSMREAIVQLLFEEIEKPHFNTYAGENTTNLVFLLTYSEETIWRSLSPLGDVDRLRVLLF